MGAKQGQLERIVAIACENDGEINDVLETFIALAGTTLDALNLSNATAVNKAGTMSYTITSQKVPKG